MNSARRTTLFILMVSDIQTLQNILKQGVDRFSLGIPPKKYKFTDGPLPITSYDIEEMILEENEESTTHKN